MVVHTGIFRLADISNKCVCRQRQNRYPDRILTWQSTNRSCSLVAVHDRHLNIHQHHIIIPRCRSYKQLHCRLAILGRLNLQPLHFQQLDSNLTVQLVILNQQHPFPCQFLMQLRNSLAVTSIFTGITKQLQDMQHLRLK